MSNQGGQSILEVIIAMAIFALIASAMLSLAVGGLTALEQGGEQTQAEALAQEGLEAIKSIREGAWNENVYSTSSVAPAGGEWVFSGEGTTETIGQFTRTISFADICRDANDDIAACPAAYTDVHIKEAAVSVAWNTLRGTSNTVERRAYVTNWDSRDWTQTDWLGESGQAIWSDTTRYDSDSNSIDIMSGGEAKLVYDWSSPQLVAAVDVGDEDVEPRGVFTEGNYAYLVTKDNDDAEFFVYDVSAPSSPALTDSLEIGRHVNDVFVSGNYAYLATEDKDRELLIVDVSNPSALSVAGFYNTPASSGRAVFALGSTVYLGTKDSKNDAEFYIFDASEASSVILLGSFDAEEDISDIFVSGSYAYVTSALKNSAKEFIVYDVSTPAAISEVAADDLGDKANGVFVKNDKAYVVTENDGGKPDFFIYDVSAPAQNLPLLGSLDIGDDNNKIIVFGGYAFVAGKRGGAELAAVDVLPSNSPEIFSGFALEEEGRAVSFGEGYIFMASSSEEEELQIISSTSAGPRHATSGAIVSSAFDMSDSSPVQTAEWDETIPPCSPACTISIDVASAPDSSGSPGAWTTWQNAETSSGTLLPTVLNGNRWMRYRANLMGDGLDTPILSEIRINYK